MRPARHREGLRPGYARLAPLPSHPEYCQLPPMPAHPNIMYGGEGRIRTSEGVRRQIYSLIPLATREPLPRFAQIEADGRNRTDDLLITSQLLYQLSYIGRGLNGENYSQVTTLSRTSQFWVLA